MLSIIQESKQSCKVHHLATELQRKDLLPDLEGDANEVLFKRNFLLMNALYQLQDILLTDQWLQVQSMDIQLFSQLPSNLPVLIEQDIALRSYYLDWDNFETSSESIEAMLAGFWQRYNTYWGTREATLARKLDTKSALQVFELTPQATRLDIRRRWRKLALKWHPDRSSGDAVMFRQVCMAWQTLR